ncbi:MAG: hypothetical protein ACMUIM_05935 [bacterium]
MSKVRQCSVFFFVFLFILMILITNRVWCQIPLYSPFLFYETGLLQLLQNPVSPIFGILTQASLYPPVYSDILALSLLTQNLGLNARTGLNNGSSIQSINPFEAQNEIYASIADTLLSPFVPLSELNPTIPGNTLSSQTSTVSQFIRDLALIGQLQFGNPASQGFLPSIINSGLGTFYPRAVTGGLYTAAGFIPAYRINDTGITLLEKYEGAWSSTVYIGASGEIKLKELTQFETDFFADIKFKEHPIAASEGSVTGVVEGNLVNFTVYFDNACIGTFTGSGNAVYISGTYIISCFDGSYIDEGTFVLEGE